MLLRWCLHYYTHHLILYDRYSIVSKLLFTQWNILACILVTPKSMIQFSLQKSEDNYFAYKTARGCVLQVIWNISQQLDNTERQSVAQKNICKLFERKRQSWIPMLLSFLKYPTNYACYITTLPLLFSYLTVHWPKKKKSGCVTNKHMYGYNIDIVYV